MAFLVAVALVLAQVAWAAPAMTVTVTGTVDDPAATVTVNGVPATNANGTFTASGVPLEFGPNTVTAVARDPSGNTATLSITVRVDCTFNIQGTIDEPVVSLTVNGKSANVQPGQFSISLPLQLGLNTLMAVATDTSNNIGEATIEVFIARNPIDHP